MEIDFELKGWLWVIAGVLFIGVGGVFSTWGWNNLNRQGQKEYLVFALARELLLNTVNLTAKPLKVEEGFLAESHYPYPTLQNTATQNVLSSDLINDPPLMELCLAYVEKSNTCNRTFPRLDEILQKANDPQERADGYRQIIESYGPLDTLRHVHVRLEKHLQENYAKQFDKASKFIDQLNTMRAEGIDPLEGIGKTSNQAQQEK